MAKLSKTQLAVLKSQQGQAFNGDVARKATVEKLISLKLIARVFGDGHRTIYILTEAAYIAIGSEGKDNQIANAIEDAAAIYERRHGVDDKWLALNMAVGMYRLSAKKENK